MNKFKYYEQVRINKSGDRYDNYIATVEGYLCDGTCYLNLGERGPKNRNGKPITQTYQEQYLTVLR